MGKEKENLKIPISNGVYNFIIESNEVNPNVKLKIVKEKSFKEKKLPSNKKLTNDLKVIDIFIPKVGSEILKKARKKAISYIKTNRRSIPDEIADIFVKGRVYFNGGKVLQQYIMQDNIFMNILMIKILL